MRIIFALLTTSLLALAPSLSFGTTWTQDKVRDPVSGRRVTVAQPMSSGSYIYHWPEKSDQVFWPYTDDSWLWFNPKSGYIAFGDDFETLDPARLEEVKAWLKANYDREKPPQSRLGLLAWAERVYTIRAMNDEFWCHFYRLMAFELRTDVSASLEYVRKALPLLLRRLDSAQTPGQLMETLYLLSEYNRRLGDEAAAADYLQQLVSYDVKDDLASFKEYLLGIAREQRGGGVASQ